ncbi:MAG: VIT1/CCC1 transporter family protein [bacterium]|nr:VIT1/CCC1 transporter family protein [bacterium]
MHYTKQDLAKHIAKEHKQSPFAEYLQEIIYGGNDGIVTTFAVVAGFAGASAGVQLGSLGYLTVMLFGLANLFADASSMGLGNFLATRSEQDRYKKELAKERHEIQNNTEMEIAESIVLLQQKGFTKQQAGELVAIYSQNENYWADFMMRYELEISDPFGQNPVFTAIATFLAFLFFGSIPLIPYFIDPSNTQAFTYAIGATIGALLLLGLLRWKVTGESIMRSIGQTILIGGISASIAYVVGIFFRV